MGLTRSHSKIKIQFMKLFKSFCKKELISRRVILRNQKVGFSEKDLFIFKTSLLTLKLSLLAHDHRKRRARAFFKLLEFQGAIKRRMQLVGTVLKLSTKTENLEKFSVLRELRAFLAKSRKGESDQSSRSTRAAGSSSSRCSWGFAIGATSAFSCG